VANARGRMIVYAGDYRDRLVREAKARGWSISDHLREIFAKHFGEDYEPKKPAVERKVRLSVSATPALAAKLRAARAETGKSFEQILSEQIDYDIRGSGTPPAKIYRAGDRHPDRPKERLTRHQARYLNEREQARTA
jgi:hypothetical protein